ncbi:acid protease [Crepidotus variabilis]|uniref:Acid protease n=1 Tax=Crepidotus variabilis TaxID=179855 RepID=A0A9P6EP94_9AGAR|nr:acid protease [Crepidotus variabilis]
MFSISTLPMVGSQRLVFVVAIVMLLQWVPVFVLASSPSILPRALVNPISLQIRSLGRRTPADNQTVGAGVSGLAPSSDHQSYYTVIQLGDINFRVALDTGSSDLWITSSDCTTSSCKKIPSYPLTYGSPTFFPVNDNQTAFSAHYADDTGVSGFIARETVHIANFTLANQTFGMVTTSNVTFTDQISGILGLGFPRLSSIEKKLPDSLPFFANLAAQGLLEYPLFAFSITRNNTGTLTLGAVDAAVVSDPRAISWFPVAEFPPFGSEDNVSTYFEWAIPIALFNVNGKSFTPIPTYTSQAQNSPSFALFDIGSPGIYGPLQDVSRIFDSIDGARLVDPSGQWAVPCDTALPMSFTFGTKTYVLQPTDYLIGPTSGSPNMCLSWPMASPPSPDGVDWQMGDAFMRTVYTIFNFGINTKEPPSIGIYPLANVTVKPPNITSSTSSSPIVEPTPTPSSIDISSFFASVSATITTTLPNVLLPTPSYSTPPYGFNSSVTATVGGVVASGLANTTYSALLGAQTTISNISALPKVSPMPSVLTLTLTESGGKVTTTTKTFSPAQMTLGVPPGWSNAAQRTSEHQNGVLALIGLFSWTLLVFV